MTTTTEPDDSGEHSIATRADRQRAAHSVGDPPRRTMAIGRVWIVGLVCLAVGALLNAPGIRKTALSQDVGWKRDVATFLADPLYDASHALLLDRPRDGIQEAIGRAGQDDVELALPSPTIDSTPTTTPTTVVPGQTTLPTTTTTVKLKDRKKFSPSKMVRLWVGGDSLSITPGESLINQAVATGLIGITSAVDGHVATGLARPEVFNWAGYMSEVINANDPDLVVLTIGSNDDQPLTGDGGVGEFGTEEWKAEYRRRVGGLMDFITSQGRERELIWVGIPPMRNVGRYNDRYFLINDLTRQEALKRPGKVVWLDMGHSIGVGNDEYTDYLTNPDGSLVQVRAGDGIHFTRAGGDRIAAQILAGVGELYDLTSWQNDVTTTTAPGATATTKPTTTPTTKKKKG